VKDFETGSLFMEMAMDTTRTPKQFEIQQKHANFCKAVGNTELQSRSLLLLFSASVAPSALMAFMVPNTERVQRIAWNDDLQ